MQHVFHRKTHTFCFDLDHKWPFRCGVASVTFFPDGKTAIFYRVLGALGVQNGTSGRNRLPAAACQGPAGAKMSPSGGKILDFVGGCRRFQKKVRLLRETCANLLGQVVISLQSGVDTDVETS